MIGYPKSRVRIECAAFAVGEHSTLGCWRGLHIKER